MGASQVAPVVKSPPANAGDVRGWFDPYVGKIPWRRAWQPTPVFLPGQSHRQRGLAGYSHRVSESPTGLKWLSRKASTQGRGGMGNRSHCNKGRDCSLQEIGRQWVNKVRIEVLGPGHSLICCKCSRTSSEKYLILQRGRNVTTMEVSDAFRDALRHWWSVTMFAG